MLKIRKLINFFKKLKKNKPQKKLSWQQRNPDKVREYHRKYRKKYPEKYREYHRESMKEWYATHKEEIKAQKKVWYQNNKKKHKKCCDRWRKNNPDRVRKTSKKWRENNPDKVRIIQKRNYKKWRAKHPYKVGPPGQGWAIIRKKVLERDNYTCQKCGKRTNLVYHLDGISSNCLAKERNNDLNNLLTLCRVCGVITNKENFKEDKKVDKNRGLKIYKLSKKMSQVKIAKKYHLSRQRISQILQKFDKHSKK